MSGSKAVTIGLDIGTTSVKAVAADGDGTVLARTRVPHDVHMPFAGAFEHDIDQAWRAGVVAALAEVSKGHDVAGVCVAAMVPSLGAVRPDGCAAGPGLLYGDARGAHERGDSGPGDSGELLAFLRWLTSNCPEATSFWPAQAVANHVLCGRGAIDSTTAVTAHPLFDFVGWDAELAASAGAEPSMLPEVVSGTEAVGVVEGLDAPLAGGTIDAMGEQLVAGADAVGDVLVILGTTLITWAAIEEWREFDGLWTIPHTAPGLSLVGGPSNAGGLFLDRARRWLAADAVPVAGATDVPVWLPYIRGERTPLQRADITASLHDASLRHGPEHLLRAAYEAAGFVVRHHLDLAGVDARRIVATGGGTRVEPWLQALADATGLPVDVVAVPEGAALGAAFIARCTAGLESSMTDASRWARTARTVEPDAAAVEPTAARYARFRALTQSL